MISVESSALKCLVLMIVESKSGCPDLHAV